jgi:hypothetical protein
MKGRKVRIDVLAVVLAIALGAAQAQAAEKIQYKLKLEKGQKYYLRMTTEQKITQTIMGKEQAVDQNVGMGANVDINDVDAGGNAWARYTYRWVKFAQKTPIGEMVYDSSNKDTPVPPMGQGFAALLGEGYSLKITPKGRVEEVKDLDKMRSNIQKKLSGGPMQEMMIKSLEQYTNEEAIKESTEASLAIYPDEPVGVGDSWSRKVVLSGSSAMILENTWTLKGRKNGVATIEVVSAIKPNPEAKPIDMGVMKMHYQVSGKQQGLIEMDESTGRMIHSKMNQELSGTATVKSTASPGAQDMIIPMKIRAITGIEVTERKE